MIYTITLNPSLDYLMHVDSFILGGTNRSKAEEIYVGGKGFNVSTILHRLGYETCAYGFIAGFSGKEIEALLQKRGFANALITLPEGFSRINVKMKGDKETEINGCGPYISSSKLDELFHQLDCLEDGDMLVLSGSIPNCLDASIYEVILQRLSHKQIRSVVDATGTLLLNVLPYHPFLIKPNQDELEDLFQVQITSEEALIHYGKKLQDMGAKNVLISRASKGALLLTEDKHMFRCGIAKGEVKNSVGAGDSMVAGFLAGYLKHQNYQEALRLGSAAGGATAFSEDLGGQDLIMELYETLQVEELL
ncbi:1-phosphofructokinase [[Eubacterium] hominis]|uniref:1-phosphofructokinase n=1 Tax=[Eubacterium] hominis TaxID=2764325 RepID=UPI003A4DDD6F